MTYGGRREGYETREGAMGLPMSMAEKIPTVAALVMI
jgi:hypothetical protein